MDGYCHDGNSNCANVVAFNTARQMKNDRNETNSTPHEDTNLVEALDQRSTSKNSYKDEQFSESANESNDEPSIEDTKRPNRIPSDTSVGSDIMGSFTGQSYNSLHFVECQQNRQDFPSIPYQPTVPNYYVYNGQLYNSIPLFQYGQSMITPYQPYNTQSFVYYQPQQHEPVTLSDQSQRISYGSYNEIQVATEIGQTKVKYQDGLELEQQANSTANQTINHKEEETSTCTISGQDTTENEKAHASQLQSNTYFSPQVYCNQHQDYQFTYGSSLACPPPYVYPQRQFDMNNYPHQTYDFTQSTQIGDKHKFKYPAIYVSATGLITVLMKNDVSVESTLDQTIRLVNHQQKLVVAVNSRGSASYLSHPGAHILQDSTTTEADIFIGRKVEMTTDYIKFANNLNCYKFDYDKIEKSVSSFSDLSTDKSVSFLFSSENSSISLDILQQCSDIASRAEYEKNQKGGICIKVNGFKIVQTGKGDVIVTGKNKYLRMSPTTSVLRLDTNFVTMDVEMNWNIRIKRGSHTVNASHLGFIVSNGNIEAAFDEQNKVHACKLPNRRPLVIQDNTSNDIRNNPNN